ncbi:MAG TPA: copper amine oxidase N-terminal domain-containing protein [Caldisericia bacterium]|nr:copper amine oxidase N-terminal domain-containing protein [Caldisericia bacterium]
MKKVSKILLITVISLLILSINSDIKSEDVKKVIKLQIGNKIAFVDDRQMELDVPPQIINGRTMVPVRFISEGLQAEVGWEDKTKTVTITMDSIDYLKIQIENLEKELSKKSDEITKKDDLIKEKDNKIEELQIKVNNLENQKVRVTGVETFKNLVDNKWSDITTDFTSTDECLYAGAHLEMLSDATFNLNINIYDPFGNLIFTAKWENQEHKKGEKWNYRTGKYYIKDYLIGAIPGVWKVKVLIDNKEVGLCKFTVTKDESYKVDKTELTEVVTCKKVVEGEPQEVTQEFSKDDERVIVFTRFKALINCGFRIKYKFYDPQGNFYTEIFNDIKGLDKDKETWVWGSIKIKGFNPEKNLGEWKCQVYVDDDLVKEIYFNIK